ncbi:MAG: hypothetical protein AAFZ52_16210 [Bacteroidota bacterium]
MQRSLLFLLLWISWPLAAQADFFPFSRHQLTLAVGFNLGYFTDRNFSPLHYRSGGFRLGLGYQRTNRNGDRWRAEIGLDLLKLTTSGKPLEYTNRYLIDLAVGYRKLSDAPNADTRILYGANYRTYVDLSLFDEGEAVTFFGLHGLELAVDGEWYSGDGHRLRTGLALPVFAKLVRPPYTGWDKFMADNDDKVLRILTRGPWTSLHRFTGLRAELGWARQVNDRWTLEANYALAYYATRRLDPFRSLNNQFALKTTLNH